LAVARVAAAVEAATLVAAETAPVIGRVFGGYGDAYYGTISEILVYNADIGVSAIQTIESQERCHDSWSSRRFDLYCNHQETEAD
jgi:hypothetical protein